jgi:hypothetical protein
MKDTIFSSPAWYQTDRWSLIMTDIIETIKPLL